MQRLGSPVSENPDTEKKKIIQELKKTVTKKSVQGRGLAPSSDDSSSINMINIEKELMPLLTQVFRPEFLNRLDDIIVFNPVSEAMLTRIVDIQLAQFVQMIAKEKNITLQVSDAAKVFLGKRGRDPIFGARPLKRAMQKYLLDALALEIIEGKIREGDSVKVDVKGEGLVFGTP